MMLPKPECTANAAFQKLYVDVVVRWWSCVFKKKKKTERRDYWYYCVITVCKESKYKEQMMCCNYLLLLNMPCMQSIIQSCFCKIASCCTTQRNEEKKKQMDGWIMGALWCCYFLADTSKTNISPAQCKHMWGVQCHPPRPATGTETTRAQ